jgi:hypothetical protein
VQNKEPATALEDAFEANMTALTIIEELERQQVVKTR